MSPDPAPREEASALDLLVGYRSSGIDTRLMDAARAELRQLRQRVEDLEMMLRDAMEQVVGEPLSGEGLSWLIAHGAVEVPTDSTGMPVLPLTDEARAALRGKEAK